MKKILGGLTICLSILAFILIVKNYCSGGLPSWPWGGTFSVLLLILLGVYLITGPDFFLNLFKKKEKQEIERSNTAIETEYKKRMDILNQFKRKAFIPVTKAVKAEFSANSKIGGFPYLCLKDDWPICPNCKKNMQLFLQLNQSELPTNKVHGLVSLIQLFYCTTDEPNCAIDLEAFSPFSKATVCRVIETKGESIVIEPNIDELYEEKLIVSWTERDDYPSMEEYESLDIDLEFDQKVYELMLERNEGLPISEDKLFGWPDWIQSEEYPVDKDTKAKYQLLFQIVSENNLPYMFGDAGIGYLTRNSIDKNELAFGWACS